MFSSHEENITVVLEKFVLWVIVWNKTTMMPQQENPMRSVIAMCRVGVNVIAMCRVGGVNVIAMCRVGGLNVIAMCRVGGVNVDLVDSMVKFCQLNIREMMIVL